MSDFQSPDLMVGDMVLYYSDPVNPSDPLMGWVSRRPGRQAINILVWAEDAGFVEKPSVRHKDDPFWRESESAGQWGQWGCFDVHPQTKALKEVSALLTKAKIEAAKKKEVA
jgi:hypothetical protein